MRPCGHCVTPTKSDAPPRLLDTSAAIAFLVEDHHHHSQTFHALAEHDLGLAGHAAFETFSVLTRLPPPARLTPAAARRLLESNFPDTRFLGAQEAARLLGSLARHGVAGGSVYDALVGAVALQRNRTLVTRDRRALDIYRALGVSVELLD